MNYGWDTQLPPAPHLGIQHRPGCQLQMDCDYQFISHFECSNVLPALFGMQELMMTLPYGMPSELARNYRQLDVHVSGKQHSCIMGYCLGVSNISLACGRTHFRPFVVMTGSDCCVAAQPLPASLPLELAPRVLDQLLQIRHSLRQLLQALKELRLASPSQALRGAGLLALDHEVSP